ncbi:hypothetical protein BD410DRAFT_778281 [Rickenella mellea]|uniref:CBF1-interacting co-repressor CIR N-terminal domain-containing protein n=1 Tax=Rickenella mellea TaxID=50990 RepID=A0A4Y7PIH7_9AGAM|nr:hypothetical protein BD410DRAFT_778281 [Rickenella mellea]
MGKLNIAHHKSYHPYRLDNIERVRKDEEEARLKEQHEEGRMMLADSEARIQLLRDRAGSSKSRRKQEEEEEKALLRQATAPREAPTPSGHINLFEDLEQSSVMSAIQRSKEADKLVKGKGKAVETEKGVPLAPSEKDLKPWYSAKDLEKGKEMDDQKRMRDLSHKSLSDPLTSINQQLATRYPSSSSSGAPNRHHQQRQPAGEVETRLNRESSERQRALELIRRKKRMLDGSETPSTVHGSSGGYGNQFNRREVEEAHAVRDRGRDRGWGREGRRDRDRRDERADVRNRPW